MVRRQSDSKSALIVQLVALIFLGVVFSPMLRGLFLIALIGVCSILTVVLLVLLIQRSNRLHSSGGNVFAPQVPTSVAMPGNHSDVSTFSSQSAAVVAQTQASASAPPLERVRALDWFQFESFMGALFTECGFTTQRFGGANPDGGIDMIVKLDGKTYGVQCKHWKVWKVGVKEIREFVGALKDRGLERGIFVTLQTYTPDAKALADRHQIELANESEITRMLDTVRCDQNTNLLAILNDTRKLCPKCESEMVLRTTRKGLHAGKQFWGCSTYPRCNYTMQLDPEPIAPVVADPEDPPTRQCVPKVHDDSRYMPKPATSGAWQFR